MPFFTKKLLFLYFCFVLLLFATPVHADYTDDSQAEFDAGTHTNTQWDSSNNWLEMSATGQTNTFATYTSRIIDSNSATTNWNTFSWVPQYPYLKELPNSGATETSYTSGNMNMNQNVLLLHLNDTSGVITDSSGNSNNLTNSGATYSAAGQFNTAMSFNGSSSYMYVADTSSLNATSSLTVSAWFKISADQSNYSTLVSKFASGSSNGWNLAVDNGAGSARFWVKVGATNKVVTFSNNLISLNVWHNLTGVYDGSAVKIYLDGVEKSTVAAAGTITNSSDSLLVGRLYPATSDFYFSGSIDEVAVWTRGLSPTEVLNLYKRGALRLRLQVRSCNDALCSGESFVGQSSSTDAQFEEQDTNTTSLPSFSLASAVSANEFFQYRVVYETSSSTLTSELKSVTVATTDSGGGGGGDTAVPEFSDFVFFSSVLFSLFFFVKRILPKYAAYSLIFLRRKWKQNFS